jgi:hypothetical protein
MNPFETLVNLTCNSQPSCSLLSCLDLAVTNFRLSRYEGMTVKNWPRYTILRGKKVWDRDDGGIVGGMTDGKFLKRNKGKIIVGKTGGEVTGMLPGERDYWC